MKALNHFFGLFLITVLIAMTSCAKQDLEINEHLAPTKKVASTTLDILPVIIGDIAYNSISDLFTAVDFTIEDEIIMMNANYPGGCIAVQFRLVADSKIENGAGNIPVYNCKLILDNNDKCTYITKETVSFDLSPLEHSGHSQVILKIADFGEVLYSY